MIRFCLVLLRTDSYKCVARRVGGQGCFKNELDMHMIGVNSESWYDSQLDMRLSTVTDPIQISATVTPLARAAKPQGQGVQCNLRAFVGDTLSRRAIH